MVAELRHSNEHRRWRGALGLAQMLTGDRQRGVRGRQLASNPAIAEELASMLEEQLGLQSQREDDLKQQAFLARTLGMIDVPETVLPVLQRAMRPKFDREVRKNAIASIAVIAGRAADRGDRLNVASLLDDLIQISRDDDRLVRQLGAYALGLMPGDTARERLIVLVDDADMNTRINAAVGLTRHNSTAGLPVFKTILSDAANPFDPEKVDGKTAADRRKNADTRNFEEFVALKNTLKAIEGLRGRLTSQERAEIRILLEPIADGYREHRIRIEAKKVLRSLSSDAE